MGRQKSVDLKNDLAELDRLTELVEDFCDASGLPLKAALETNLVLEEIVTNVISYAYTDAAEHLIRVELDWEKPLLTIRVSDDGRAFNPLELPPPDLEQSVEERSIGGLGIHFVRQLMPEVVYERGAGQNILLLRKTWLEAQ